MHADYWDIRDKILADPTWFDENAVPRYCSFTPTEMANIYAREAVLAEIRCQGCGHVFRVAFSTAKHGRDLATEIRDKEIHYGDPPNIRCCGAGPTMNSEPRRVLEYWLRDISTNHHWRRDRSLELDITPAWVCG